MVTYIFQFRYIQNYTGPVPLPQGKYNFTNDFYEVDRYPRIGELGTAYAKYVKQIGKLIRTSYEKFEQE